MWEKWATLKLMRKLLHQYSCVPNKLFTDEMRSYAATAPELGSEAAMNAAGDRLILGGINLPGFLGNTSTGREQCGHVRMFRS
jgi:hypothetical protein